VSLPHDYGGAACSLARSLEVIGERWTLLIVRDAFYGARRFGDFVDHLRVPRSVLTKRLDKLVADGILARTAPDARGYAEYELTDKGRRLWPIVRHLMDWGDEFYAQGGPPRTFEHIADGGRVAADGRCERCGEPVDVEDLQVSPGPGLDLEGVPDNPVTEAMKTPHRLLASVHE
jgi:DNA-binding HxlR family transcriptional regulator